MKKCILVASAVLALSTSFAFANQTFSVDSKNGQFSPSTLSAKANEGIEINITNSNNKEIEFQNKALNVDVDVNPHATQKIVLDPLPAGDYIFNDDEHPASIVTLTVK